MEREEWKNSFWQRTLNVVYNYAKKGKSLKKMYKDIYTSWLMCPCSGVKDYLDEIETLSVIENMLIDKLGITKAGIFIERTKADAALDLAVYEEELRGW